MLRIVKLILTFMVVFLLFILLIWLLAQLFHFYIIKNVFNYVVQNFINVTGMSPWLAKGLVIFLLIPFIWAILEVTKLNLRLFKKRKSYRKLGLFIIIFYIGLFFLSMFFLSQGTYFGHMKGEVMKYYAVTPEGIRFFDSPGFDPKYGTELKAVNTKIIEHYERAKRGMKPKLIDISKEIEFFDSITGNPKVWYYKDNEGNYEFFDQPGFHPVYWTELQKVTREVVLNYKKRLKKRKQEIKQQEKITMKKLYIEKYINPIISNIPVRIDIELLIVDKKTWRFSESSRTTGYKIKEKLIKENTKMVSNLFKEEFFSDGNFKNLFQGNTQDIFNLELGNYIDYLILGTQKAIFSKDPRLEDLVSCTLNIDMKICSTKTGEIISFNSFENVGIGTGKEKAESKAVDLIIEKVKKYITDKIILKGGHK